MRYKMRVSIREQLGFLVLICSLLGLMTLALATVRLILRVTRCPALCQCSHLLVVPKLQFYHQYTALGSFPHCLSQGCPGLLDPPTLSKSMPGRHHAGSGPVRLVAVHSGYFAF